MHPNPSIQIHARLAGASLLSLALASCTSSLSAYQTQIPEETTDEVTGDDPGDPDGTDDPPISVEIVLDRILPDFGTENHVVEIEGGPFEGNVSVTFDGVVSDVLAARSDRVVVEVPAGLGDGWVDVHVQSEEGASKDPVRFNSFESAQGGFGALGVLEWSHLAGDYWTPESVDWGYSQVVFPIGPAPSWAELLFAPAPETCVRSYTGPTIYVYTPGIDRIFLEASDAAQTRITLTTPVGYDYIYEFMDLPASKVITGADYALDPMTGNPDWPALSAQGLVGTIPSSFNVTDPPLESANFPPVNRSINLAWSGPNNGDAILAVLTRQRWIEAQGTYVVQESISCWLDDDGNHTIPDLWTDWLPFGVNNDYDIVAIDVARVNSGSTTLEHNDGLSGVLGSYWVRGVGLAQ